MSDREIICLIREQSTRRKAFEIIVDTYSSRLYWYIRHMVLSHDDANDLLQNTFIKAWLHLDSFRAESKLSTWLYKIAINETLTFLKQKNETIYINDMEAEIENQLEGDPFFDGDKTSILLQKAIQQLPTKQRTIFNMKYFEEMKYEDIKDILNTSVGALKASYHIAVKKIEEYISNNN